jgi:methylated-DNA-[protein]-cysteine S-methyltransferase
MTADTRGTVVPAHWVLATRLGELTVVHEGGVPTGLYFPRHWPRPDRAGFGVRADRGSEKDARQLHEYLAGDRSVFALPIEARGAEFDRRVWDLIIQVPYPAAAGQALPVAALAHRVQTEAERAPAMGAGIEPCPVGSGNCSSASSRPALPAAASGPA